VKSSAFRQWREHMGVSQIQAADWLGVTSKTIHNWETGRHPDGSEKEVPKAVALACAALQVGFRDYQGIDDAVS